MANCLARLRGTVEYSQTAAEMAVFTDCRTSNTPDELWLLQHPAVFTQGTSCHNVPSKNPAGIPLIHTNRGGQISYHGPGQLIVYLMLDLKRMGIGPKVLVGYLEDCLVELLSIYGIKGERRNKAPGVYVSNEKIAALGLRIRQGKCFHGLSLNVDMDLVPFDWIDPCGYPDLKVTQLKDHGVELSIDTVANDLMQQLLQKFQWDSLDIAG